MDRLPDPGRRLWPADPKIWFIRVLTLGFTGRAAAALAMIDADPEMLAGPLLTDEAIALALAAAGKSQAGAMRAIYLLRRGPILVPLRWVASVPSVKELRGRQTVMLFYPVSAPLWADLRFVPLCGEIGLIDIGGRRAAAPTSLAIARCPPWLPREMTPQGESVSDREDQDQRWRPLGIRG